MKPFHSFAMLAAIAAVGQALAVDATTTPVGYTTTVLKPNAFNLAGLTVQQPTKIAGVLDASSSNSVTDTGVDFVATLGAPGNGLTYVLELADGTIQEITSWTNAGVLSTPDNISSKVTNGTTTYKLRKAATISDVFGATNTAGLTPDADGDYTTNNDQVLIPNGNGTFTTVYYYNDGAGTTGWFDSDGNSAEGKAIVYTDGFLVKRVGGIDVSLVVSGEVKTTPSGGVLAVGFNYLNAVAPAGLTLDSSNLKNFVSADSVGDYLSVDNVYIPQAAGGYRIAYYFNDGAGTTGWFDTDGNDAAAASLDGGFLILNRGVVKPYTVSVPTGYSSL